MQKTRLEAFSDGVIAIIITIMVLEIRVPHGTELKDLTPLIPVVLSYIMSFIFLGIYWNNHHHLLHTIKEVNGGILWANLHFLFWLSLAPFVTAWMGENHFAALPVAFYAGLQLILAISYFTLQRTILKSHGPNSVLAKALGKDYKGKASLALYSIAVVSCYFNSWIAGGIFVLVGVMWLIPDKRIEAAYKGHTPA